MTAYCLHHSDPTICKVCNRPKEELIMRKAEDQNDQLMNDDYYYRGSNMGHLTKQATDLK